jgi:AhpD family alkylhydroperoxidase
MDLHIAKPESVPAVLKELAQIKVAVMVGCPF